MEPRYLTLGSGPILLSCKCCHSSCETFLRLQMKSCNQVETRFVHRMSTLTFGFQYLTSGPAGNVSDTNVVSLSVYSTGAALLASCNKRNEKSIELKEKYVILSPDM
ncbi:hypothetical protein ACSBR2_015855 [Camellia fascicularis]